MMLHRSKGGQMGKLRKLPEYSYDDNGFSAFGFVSADLMKSKQFQNLSPPARLLYITCIAHRNEEKARECLSLRLSEINEQCGCGWSTSEIKRLSNDPKGEYFVFPACQYQEYGFKYGWFSKYMSELIDAGFICRKWGGRNQYTVTVYSFDKRWKR